MKYLISTLFFTSILFLSHTYAQDIPEFIPEEWSGTATMTYTVRGKQSFSEIHHEARISKGQGTATTSHRIRSEDKERIREGQASGSGPSSIFIGFNDDPRTYAITLTTPAAFGTMTTTIKGSGSETTSMGYDESSIIIPDQKLGDKTDVLSGTVEDKTSENGETAVLRFSWNFYR